MQDRLERAADTVTRGRRLRREQAEFVLAMSRHLAPRDRLLIEHVYRDGRSAADYARLSRCSVRSVQQRLQNLIKRMHSQHFQYFLAHESVFPRRYRSVARRMVIEGRGLRHTARLTGLSLHRVRHHHAQLLAILDTQSLAWSPPPDSPARRPPAHVSA